MKNIRGIVLFLVITLIASNMSCIFGTSMIKVMSYRNNNVYLSNRTNYTVGQLPEGWKKARIKAHSVAFHNEALMSTIATDAFCGRGYEDLPLTLLTQQLVAGVENYKITEQKEFMLDERGALRSTITGSIDGVPLHFDIVVMKKNDCMIDMMCITGGVDFSQATADFTGFYMGFHYE